MKLDPLETELLSEASKTAQADHRRFTPIAEYEGTTLPVVDVLTAALAIALIVLAIALITSMFELPAMPLHAGFFNCKVRA
jgi:hypothetical protein